MATAQGVEDEDYPASALLITTVDFDIQVLKEQQKAQQQLSSQIQNTLDKGRNSIGAVSQEPEQGWFSSMIWGETPEPVVVKMGSSLTKKEQDKLKQQQVQVDQHAIDIRRRITELEEQKARAEAELKRAMREPIFTSSRARSGLKAAVRSLASQVDPKGTECAELLGKLFLRTPFFFEENNLVGRGRTNTGGGDSIGMKNENLPMVILDLKKAETWDVYQKLDQLVEEAVHQDEGSILQLLALLLDDNLQPAQRHHLIRIVEDKATHVMRRDTELMNESEHKSAMVANWPRPNGESFSYKAYTKIAKEVHDQAEEYEQDKHAADVESASRGSTSRSSHSAPSRSSASGQAKRRTSAAKSESKHVPNALERTLKVLDSNFADAVGKDHLLHISPQVMTALVKIATVSLSRLATQEMVLYGRPSLPEVQWEKPHWFVRRMAAMRVCRLAAEGNSLAIKMITRKLLQDQEHWMVRVLTAEDTCRFLGHLNPEKSYFRDVIEEITRVLFTFPVVQNTKSRNKKHQRIHAQVLTNVQKVVEDTLVKEIPHYPPGIRHQVVQDLLGKSHQYEDVQKRQVMNRILHACSGLPGMRHFMR